MYGAIGGWFGDIDATTLVRELADLDVDEIRMRVHSPGGDAFDGIAIYNALRRHQARVVATVDGLAASAASLILMAADDITMGQGTEVMIHDPWSFAIGNPTELRKEADDLDKLADGYASVYGARASKGTSVEWRDAMRAETWYSAEEAVAAGLAHHVDGVKAPDDAALVDDEQARALLHLYRYSRRAAAPAPYIPRAAARTKTPDGAPSGQPPVAEPRETNPEQEASMPDALRQGLRERLGIKVNGAEYDDEGLLARLDKRLATAQTPPVPAGVEMIDAGQLAQLRADATAGREARTAQLVAERETTVNAAVNDGRIAPARRAHWLAALEADPGAAETLAALAPGLIPLAPKGYTGGPDQAPDEESLYAKFWGSSAQKES